jgi:hypothetical protein
MRVLWGHSRRWIRLDWGASERSDSLGHGVLPAGRGTLQRLRGRYAARSGVGSFSCNRQCFAADLTRETTPRCIGSERDSGEKPNEPSGDARFGFGLVVAQFSRNNTKLKMHLNGVNL